MISIAGRIALGALLLAPLAAAAQTPVACPPSPVEVVRSRGGTIKYLGSVPDIPDLCRIERADGAANFYYGVWRSDWPGAGDAYPAIKAVLLGGLDKRVDFTTYVVPGQQFVDSFINEGMQTVVVGGISYMTVRLAHERRGIEGNTYHSIITSWRDVETGINLRTFEEQISGQSYGPDTTWEAVRVEPLPR